MEGASEMNQNPLSRQLNQALDRIIDLETKLAGAEHERDGLRAQLNSINAQVDSVHNDALTSIPRAMQQIEQLAKERDDATNLLRELARITCAEHWYDDELEDGTEDCSVCKLLERVRAFVTKE
jgi:chromosome segregation ATPase